MDTELREQWEALAQVTRDEHDWLLERANAANKAIRTEQTWSNQVLYESAKESYNRFLEREGLI